MAFQTSTNNYLSHKYIVGVGLNVYPTIQSAINAANTAGGNAIIYIRPGTYSESLTLYSTVHLEGAENSIVEISGVHTPPASGTVNFTRLKLTSATDIISSALAGTTVFTFNRCLFNITDGYVCDLPNWTGAISLKYCTESSTKNGIVYNAGGSAVNINYSTLGAGTAAMTVNGATTIFSSVIGCPITITGSGVSTITGGSILRGLLTTGATANVGLANSASDTGAGVAIDHNSSVTMQISTYAIRTSNAVAISGSGSVQSNTLSFIDSKGITATEVLTGVTNTGEIFADTITRMENTGFYSWAAAGPYYDDTTLGSFNLLVGGTGYIKGRKITWVPQTISGMTSGATWLIYIDATGTIGKTSSRTSALFVNNVVLFECLYDETPVTKQQHTVRENHAYTFPVAASNYLHDTAGIVIENINNGANIVAGTTGVRISITGDDVLADHGLYTTINAGTNKTFKQFYKTAGGKWAVAATSTDFPASYNSSGTVTAVSNGNYGVYRLYVGKDSGNSAYETYYAVMHNAQFSSAGNAATAITNNTISVADGELAALELAQLGFITLAGTTDLITTINISKSTLRSTLSTGSGSSTASGVTTTTTDFNNLLSAADTNVQAALDTLDDIFVNTASAVTSPILTFKKYRGVASLTAGDLTGTVKFGGYDGTQVTDSARITSTSSGTIASTRVAGDLKFYTHPDSAAADPTLRMTIAPTGAVTIASPDSGVGLTVSGGGLTVTSGNIAASSGTLSASTTVTAGTNLVSTAGNLLLPTTSSTVGQIQINSVKWAHSYGTQNTFVGANAGNTTLTTANTLYNTALGFEALKSIAGASVNSNSNTAVGWKALTAYIENLGGNSAFGAGSALAITSGSNNVFFGKDTGGRLVSGSNNCLIGTFSGSPYAAGYNYTGSESNNICIHAEGTTGESNKIRIGRTGTGAGQQNAAYIAGTYTTGATPSGTAKVALIDSVELHYGLAGTAGQVLMGGTAPAFSTTAYPATSTQGDILYASANSTITTLAKDANATRYLSNTGTTNNPAWAQVALATGVSGTLPPSNGGRNTVSNSTTSNAVQMAVNTSYIATSTDGATLVVYTLPGTAAIGDTLEVVGVSTGLWEIDQNASDTIFYDNAGTTPGTTGKVTCQAGHKYSSVKLMNVASGNWVITSVTGAITLAL